MNILSVQAIKKTYSYCDHWENIKVVSRLDEEEFIKFLSVFHYGRIVGIQEERARRNRQAVSTPIISESYILTSISDILKASSGIDSQELRSILKYFFKEQERERGQEVSPRVKDFLELIVKIKEKEEKEKSQ